MREYLIVDDNLVWIPPQLFVQFLKVMDVQAVEK